MQFLLIAYDAKDEQAQQRRLAARERHLAQGPPLVAEGKALFGTAILDDEGRMVGSMLVMDFPTRAEFDAWLETEPYVTDGVWAEIQVQPCQAGPVFLEALGRR
ncbi:YciI family protein [Streptomyces sp. CT34]|uniref:YciI family protein n=1 Tax=Streptomyces sp. CT34 TaxID=1553907 RepID=UPI0005BCBA3C|nr:YciI family protein [Streptomyces sp. CT34]